MVADILAYLPSITYPPAQEGRWSPVTSTLNWCEEDYYATVYSAEIINTLTNLWFMYLSAKGIHNCLRHGHDAVFLVSYIGYLLVGTGSFFFHATLKYPMQLVDELSMIYTTCLMCYVTFSFGKSKPYRMLLGISLVGLSLFITMYYHFLQDPAFHQTTYAILTAIVFFRAVYVMEVTLRPTLRSKEREATNPRSNGGTKKSREQVNRRDIAILKQMWTLIAWGLSIFLGGFLLWYLDIAHCSTLRRWRREIGMPWGFLLELHGWWHVMTGYGGYSYIVWGIWLRHCLNGRQEEYRLRWPGLTSMPVVVRQQKPDGNGQTSGGSAKKEL